jgi:hypothetical protein
MKYNPFIFSFLIFIVLCGSINATDNYIINNNSVYINDSEVYLSATPHTLSSSGWVYFNLTSKVYTGNIDVCWGFNTSISKPTKAELYKPHWINTTTDHQKTFYNPSFVVYTGDKLDYGNSYNTNHRYAFTEQIINDNGTIYITSNASFDSFDTDETNYTVYWHTRYDNHYLWKDFTDSFNSVNHDYKGFDKWYYIKNISIISDKEYTVRAWVDIPVNTEKQSGKYYFAIKPSHETIAQAISIGHFYNLDPWWDVTWAYRKEIILTGHASGAQTDYQILLNVTYDSDMQSDFDDLRFTNDTHELDSWLEFKVDGFYALVWVEFSTTPANTVEQTYYMYYGNAGAASDWDGVATFYSADVGFDSTTGWTEVDPNSRMSVTGGQLVFTDLQRNVVAYTYNAMSPTYNPLVFEFVYKYTDGASATPQIYVADGIYTSIYGATNAMGVRIDNSAGSGLYFITRAGGTTYINTVHTFTATTIAQTWYFRLKLISGTSATLDAWLDDPTKSGAPDYTSTLTTAPTVAMTHVYAISGYLDGQSYTSSGWVDNVLVRKYAVNPPTYAFGSEEFLIYIPPDPITLTNTTGNFWANHTWAAGSGNVTDGYNVTINSIWHNGTDTFYNDTYSAHAWQNITVYAFNSTGTGTLSSGSVNQNTQIPNNAITITNTSDWTGNAGEVVYVDYDATDDDSDIATFSCNRIDLFTDFDTSTGKGNWTATANIYYVDFGVSDGYGSISNYTMTLRELSVKNGLIDELKLIMSEITSELKSINMGNYLVYAFILIGILFIILFIQLLNNCIYRG